ncbi:DNA polymerase III subunit alpha [Ureaplasma miroungigenitalium]|uniref:DNA polymerase III PolC-type n=1 Tax=Ureaplasma miroungigenitalium TaxID=1042321 RepID=A0ABT3BLS9_9BACT|nr:DNA polymerase III subunit alpha [Ureaplasma miroungigenitalium]MCV3728208.1 DNA polymerase III subunit alpha [Ureaplasma miroungigenitalium]
MQQHILLKIIPTLSATVYEQLPTYDVKKEQTNEQTYRLHVSFSEFVDFQLLEQISCLPLHPRIHNCVLVLHNLFNEPEQLQALVNHLFMKHEWLNPEFVNLQYENEVVTLTTSSRNQLVFLKNHQAEIKTTFAQCGLIYENLVISFIDCSATIEEQSIEQQNQAALWLAKLNELEQQNNAAVSNDAQNWNRYNKQDNKAVTKLTDININMTQVNVIGKIFLIEQRERNNKDIILTFYIQDDTDTLNVTYYLNANNRFKEHFLGLKVNDYIGASGEITSSFNDPTKTIPVLKAKKIWKIDNYTLEGDNATIIPRTELAFHTKMTSSDCIIGTEELVDFALKNKINCIGITDRYVVQAYPEIQTYLESKKIDEQTLKIIYGLECEVLPPQIDAVYNIDESLFVDQEYIVFDLETTGLYPNYDEIIEFGGVLVKNGQILERKQFFMKPSKPLSQTTIKLTKITDDHVKHAISELEGLKTMLNWFKDRILVAHNAINFDINFINIRLQKYGIPVLTNMYVDTLMLSRSLNPTYRSHRLGAICKKNNIPYDDLIAHRADYDAEVLVSVFNIMLSQLINEHKIKQWDQVNPSIQNRSLRNRFFGDQITIYAKNQDGIKNIYELVSKAHTDLYNNRPTITIDFLSQFKDNLIITNAVYDNELINSLFNKTDAEIIEQIKLYDFITLPSINCFKNQIHNEKLSMSNLQHALNQLVFLAKQQGKPIVASSHVYYLQPSDKKYYDVYVNSKGLNGRLHRFANETYVPDLHYLDQQEFQKELTYLNDPQDIKKILTDDVQVVLSWFADNIKPLKKDLYTPKIDNVDELTKNFVYETAKKIYGENLPDIVQARIDKELNSIIIHGFSVVYWISHLLVKKSNEDGYSVGSRGSVGSSLVATFLNITDVNPLMPHYLCQACKYYEFVPEAEDGYDLPAKKCPQCQTDLLREGHNIPFETFLGFNGDKVPDIDLNFSGVYQPVAHQFIKDVFGDDHSYRAGTVSKLKDKTTYAMVKKYFEEKNDEIIRDSTINLYVQHCFATKKTTGQHPGGIIIVPKDLSIYDFTPYNFPADDENESWKTTHFAFEYIHNNLLKFDILGHDNPTILKLLEDLTNIKQENVPINDEKTMKMFYDISVMNIQSADVLDEKTGAISIPEFGTSFVRQMLVATQPRSFADLIRISGLSHGTDVYLNNAQTLITQHNKKLKDVIACRDDIMSYLIQNGIDFTTAFFVMEDVRKGKKIKPDHEKVLRENNIPDWYIESANKIQYMFPKAHATAYVMHAWKFAWYKLYYPLEYYAAFLSVRSQNFDLEAVNKTRAEIVDIYKKIKRDKNASNKELDSLTTYEIIIEFLARGIKLLNIDINHSHPTDFLIDREKNALIPPLICIPSLGEKVAASIVEQRNIKPFSTIEDIVHRSAITTRQIEVLKNIGALDDFDESAQTELF